MQSTLVVFTDGACHNNGKPNAKAGYGIHFPNGEFEDISKPFHHPPITSPRAELYAIWKALSLAFANPTVKHVHVFTDSEYAKNCLMEWAPMWVANGWKRKERGKLKPVKNLDLIQPLYRLYTTKKDCIKFTHVRAHTGKDDPLSKGNAVADRLAGEGVKNN